MKSAVTQEDEFGCGIACVAFLLNIGYAEAAKQFEPEKARSLGFICRELTSVLNNNDQKYYYRYLKTRFLQRIYKEGTIVFIKKSERYPAGHYLVRANGCWMDPWLNYRIEADISKAISGYRRRLPGKPIYALFKK